MGSTPDVSLVEGEADVVGGRCVVALWCSSSDVVVVDLQHDSEHITIVIKVGGQESLTTSLYGEHTRNIQYTNMKIQGGRRCLRPSSYLQCVFTLSLSLSLSLSFTHTPQLAETVNMGSFLLVHISMYKTEPGKKPKLY